MAPLLDLEQNDDFVTRHIGPNQADIDAIARLGEGKLDFTVGSALDIFGGAGLRYEDMVAIGKDK